MNTADVVPSALWRTLLPQGVVAYETRQFVHSAHLHPLEAIAVSEAVSKRVEEFAAGRACAREALAELGCAPAPLLRHADRSPIWPPGVVGSITHTDAYCGVAVARSETLRGIGIDAEVVGRLDDGALRLIGTPGERTELAAMSLEHRRLRATLLFSAKEAFFKCQASAGGERPKFHDVELEWSDGEFVVRPQGAFASASIRPRPLTGRYAVEGDLVFTAIGYLKG